ncbi:hypothetical protein JTB14_013267 [Gonioctena quinquepunctata]|nr:hypothetical protein JTB14_013267 [Gonioctena quinquepunctata]
MYRPPQNTNRVKSIKSKFESIENNNSETNCAKNGYRNNLKPGDSPNITETPTEYARNGNQILQRQSSDQGKRNIKRTPAFRVDKSLERANGFQRNSYNRSTLFESKLKQFSAVKYNCDSNSNLVSSAESDREPLLGNKVTKKVHSSSSNKKPVLLKSKSSHDFQYIRSKFDRSSVKQACEEPKKDDNYYDFVNTENLNNCDLALLYTEPIPKALRNKNVNDSEKVVKVTSEPEANNIHSASTLKISDKQPDNVEIPEGLTDTLKIALKRPLPIGPAPKKPPRTFQAPAEEELPHNLEKNISFLHVSKQPEKKLPAKPKTSPRKTDPKYMLRKLENALRNNKLRARKQAKVDISTTSGEDSDDSLLFRSKSNRTLPRLPSQATEYNDTSAFNFSCLNGLRFAMTNYEKIKEPNSCFFVGSPSSRDEPIYAEPFHYRKDSLDSAIRKRGGGSTRSRQSARNSLYYMVSGFYFHIFTVSKY